MAKTYGEYWRSNPACYVHPEKPGNWIARARLLMRQEYLKRAGSGVSAGDLAELAALGKLAFPGMKPAVVYRHARNLDFEF